MAWQTGSPVALSHTSEVSRWLVMPMAAKLAAVIPARAMASTAVLYWVVQISRGSCSTHPGRGNSWVNSCLAELTIFPSWLYIMLLELVVPWSRDRINL